MEIYWILIILGIVVALNSAKIDKAARGNSRQRELLIALCAVLLLVIIYTLLTLFK